MYVENHAQPTRVAIIGAGLIGLLAAYQLQRRGATVTLIEQGDIGAAASAGNTGWIVPSLSGPVPAPGLTTTSLKWMLKRNSPLYIRPTSLPRLAPWLWQFWRHCNVGDYQAGLRATAELNRTTFALFDALRADGLHFEMHGSGILVVSKDRAYIEHFAEDLGLLSPHGYECPRVLSGSEVRALEPALSQVVQGGVFVHQDRYIRPETLIASVVKRITETGATIHTHARVTGVHRSDQTIVALQTTAGTISADHFLIAAGAWSGQVARLFGAHLPMQAGTGYSLTIPDPAIQLRYPLYLADARVACSPFDGQLRLAGTMELSGIQPRINPKRLAAIRDATMQYFSGWQDDSAAEEWVGMRPMAPDGLPVIGKLPQLDNLYASTGHAMLGVTLAPVTGVAIADLICTGQTDLPIAPFSPARFRQ